MMYRQYLTNCYQLMVAAEPLLDEAAFLLSDEGWEGELKAFYRRHLEDEKGHAKWMLEDIGEPGQLHFGVAGIAGMAYYLIRHVHPVALMGYMLALEGEPISDELIKAVANECGEKAVRTLRHHAEEDPDHLKQLKAVFIPDEWKPLVENTRKQTLILLEHL